MPSSLSSPISNVLKRNKPPGEVGGGGRGSTVLQKWTPSVGVGGRLI